MSCRGTLASLLQGWLDLDPTAPALGSMSGAWLSRGDLVVRLAAAEQRLRQLGLQPRDRVAVLMPQGFEGAIVALQVASACSLASLRPGLPPGQWPALLRRLAPAALVLAPGIAPELAAAAERLELLLIDPSTLLNSHEAPRRSDGRPEGQDAAGQFVVIATSGSSGLPKWVNLHQSALLQGCRATARTLELGPADRSLLALPLHHVHGLVSGLLMPLISGGSVVVAERFQAAELLDTVRTQPITWISLPPAMHRALLDQHRLTPLEAGHRLRFLRSGAISLPPHLMERLQAAFGIPVIEAYGMSECPHICGNPLQAPRAGSVGRPVVEHLAILGPDGVRLPPGEWGEVAVRGAPLMAGYVPAAVMESDVASEDASEGTSSPVPCRDGWFPTGDQGRLDGDGYLYLSGRLGETVNRGGLKVVPAVVDAALLSHPDVREAVAFALPHPSLGQDLAAAVVPRTGVSLGEQELRAHAFASLAPHEVPSRILVLADLPRGAGGKLQRLSLAEQLAEALRSPPDPPSGELEQQIAAVFGEVLEQDPPGRDANFFQLGGDSLAGTRVISRLADQLGLELQPSLLFRHPSVRSLAERLRTLQPPGAEAAAAAIPRAEPLDGDWSQGCQVFAASHAQSRLWFLHQLQSDLTAYHLPSLWRLSGDLDRAALAQALTDLIARHPTLRTSFQLQDGEVLQILHPPAPFQLEAEPLGDRDPRQLIRAWQEQDASTPWDLRSGLLLRARLLQLADREHLLLLNHHHIASDGWSRSILATDLSALYNAHRSGQFPRLPPLRVQYQDYALWQRRRLSGRRLQELQEHWIPQLRDLEPLELPGDHPRPAIPSHRGARLCFPIEADLLAPLEAQCRSEGATLQMGLLALLALLLHRYSRQDDFAIGIPVWGRNDPDLESLIGFFINTLPIRTRFSPELSFRQLLCQVRDTSLAAYDHQVLPFEQMVEALKPERDTSRNPLVQVMLQLTELPLSSTPDLDGLDVEVLESGPDAARFDLEFVLRRDANGGINATLVYATDLFSASRIERLASHLLTLLASALDAPDAPAASLSILPEAERQRIESWQQGPGIAVSDLCIDQLVAHQVERNPDAIALVFEDQELAYRQLNASADQLARHLIALGVGPDVIVAVCLERSVELIVSLLAILKAGGAFLPLDPAWPSERMDRLLRAGGEPWLLVRAGREPPLRWPRSIVLPLDSSGVSAATPVTGPHDPDAQAGARLDSTAYLLFTSGSTGQPKAVPVDHRALASRVWSLGSRLDLAPGRRMLAHTTPVFDIAIVELLITLAHGASIVLANESQRQDPAALAALIVSHGVELLQATPSLLQALLTAAFRPGKDLLLLAGGEPLAPALAESLMASGARLINGYGPTEATIYTTLATIRPGEAVRIGRPLPGSVVRLLDSAGHPCPIGIPGELHIGGAGLARGYLNNPELTAERFIPDPFSDDPSARLYKTGDLVSWNPDGTLAFHGRIDQQIKLRGYRIEPGEIEANLLAHPGVAQAAVVLRHDDPSNPRLIAYWVPQQSTADCPTSDQLRSFLAQRLPESMVPSAFAALEALPLTTNGKLDRKALPAPSLAGDLDQRLDPSTDLERQLHAIWAEVLGHADFGITDNFWLIGGHSLVAAGLVARIERELGSSIPMEAIFRNPTISAQADWLLEPSLQSPGHLVTLQPMGSRPPLHVVHGWGGTVGGFIHLARALAPHRPVLGMQASADGSLPQGASVSQLADAYAEEILAAHQDGPIHLMGYSAGGWYAYAVAAALFQRGAPLGIVAILDTTATTRIHRRLGLALFGKRVGSRLLPALRGMLRPPNGQRRSHFVVSRLRLLNQTARLYLRMGVPGPCIIRDKLRGVTPPAPEPFIQLLIDGYRPPRLPIQVDLFAPQKELTRLQSLWRFYAQAGVRNWSLFDNHLDFRLPELAPQLAQVLETALQRSEGIHKDS